MRRLSFSLLVVSLFTGMMGCHCHHIAGVCDCTPEEPPCAHRAPYVQMGYPASMVQSPATPLVTSPSPIPDTIPPIKDAR